jgi:hypothetical protein
MGLDPDVPHLGAMARPQVHEASSTRGVHCDLCMLPACQNTHTIWQVRQ